MFLPGARSRRRLLALAFSGFLASAPAHTQAPPPTFAKTPPPAALLFRIFLRDGRTLTSYGEYARVGDRVVFSLPLGAEGSSPRLHLASVPAGDVDWTATDRYRDALRASHYADTRGEQDFAAMSGEVARLLNEIAITSDKAAQLALAERALKLLADWPGAHYAYRADEVRQIQVLVEEVVSDLRAARGESRFDLNLVAAVAPPPIVPLMPPPTLQESIQQALTASKLADSPSDRTSLLQSAVTLIDDNRRQLPPAWVNTVRNEALGALDLELQTNRAYAQLKARALERASVAARRADVRAVERTVAEVRKRDLQLGQRRPDEVQALVAALDERLDAARRLRLARDQWAMKEAALNDYGNRVRPALDALWKARPVLDDIRTLSGPDARRLQRFRQNVSAQLAKLRDIAPPDDARAVHGVAISAMQLADSAARTRQQAVVTASLKQAWDASSAAAGALMLVERARNDLVRVLRPPDVQ